MADIFVSYARKDQGKVTPFIELLESQGWTVWWDQEINPGLTFSKVIERELSLARCVIVFWSNHSVTSDWVNAEANDGLQRDILIPVLLESATIPLVFRQTQGANLAGWPGNFDQIVLDRLLNTISNLVNKPVTNTEPPRQANKRWIVALVVVLAFLGIASLTFLNWQSTSRTDKPEIDVPNIDGVTQENTLESKPVASIVILPFKDMENDISIEVEDFVSRWKNIQIIHYDPLNQATQKADYSLQAAQFQDRLIVSLFDTTSQQTRFNQEINLEVTTLDEAVRIIVGFVAREFDETIDVDREIVSNEVYLRYLHAQLVHRQPYTSENLTQIISILESVIREAPRFDEAQASLCMAYIGNYRNSGAVADFENAEKYCFRAARLSESNPLVSVALGALYETAGQLEEAAGSYEHALELSPFRTEAISGLAGVRFRQGQIEAAVELYKLAQAYEPDKWAYYSKLAELYFRRGQWALAIEQSLKAKKLVKDKRLILSDLGAAYFMMEDFDNAVLNWEESLALGENFAALSNLGSAYYFQGNYTQAIDTYQRAMEINTDDYRIWKNAGEAAFAAKLNADKYNYKAIELAESAVSVNPDDPETLSALAGCYASIGNETRAKEFIARALKLGGNDIYVLYDVAIAHSRLGDRDQMDKILAKMVESGYSRTLIERDANFF